MEIGWKRCKCNSTCTCTYTSNSILGSGVQSECRVFSLCIGNSFGNWRNLLHQGERKLRWCWQYPRLQHATRRTAVALQHREQYPRSHHRRIHTKLLQCRLQGLSVALQTQGTAVTNLKLRLKLQVTMIWEISCQLVTIQATMTLQYKQQYYMWSQQNVQQLHRSQTASYDDRGKLLPGAAGITLHCNLLQDNQLYQWNQTVHCG